ncbi:MAG: electron transfer flavoprotein subunit beta/FixA family protein [Chloroflexi bacterium]|nr:electron transfer flavoprotein subunit beta/FixA family protein [Chloroflexota bacterium]
MHVVACIKQTPDTAAKVEVKDGHVTWGDAALVVNPWDEYAVEEALRLKEKHEGKATAICMGPESAKEALKTCLAMGCDEAILISDPALKGSDSTATATVLAAAIRKMGDVDIAVFGKQAIDGDTGFTAVAVAATLGWNALTFLSKIESLDPAGKTIVVERSLEEGKQLCSSKLPAAISVVKDINEPRYPSFMGIRKAAKANVPVWSAADIGVEASQVGAAGSAVTWPEIYPLPAREGSVEILEGSPEEIAAKLADGLIAEKVI